MSRLKALVLAAGKSSRIASVADGIPKPLLKIQATPVLALNLKLLAEHGIKKVWINLHHQAELIQKEIGDGKKWGVSVAYSYEEALLGTAGAVKKLVGEFSDQPFLVLYGDNYTNCDLTALLKHHRKSKAIGTLAVFDERKNLHSGIAGGHIFANKRGTVEKFFEGKMSGSKSSTLVNAGIYAFQPEIIRYIPEGFSDFGKDIFSAILKKGLKLALYKMSGFCLALDTPEAYLNAQKLSMRIP